MVIFPCTAKTTIVQGHYARYDSPRRLVGKLLSETEENNVYACLFKCNIYLQVNIEHSEKRRELTAVAKRFYILRVWSQSGLFAKKLISFFCA